jgi:hypothetical protein
MSTNSLRVHGLGVVSPAGWGLASFRQSLEGQTPLPVQDLARPGWTRSLRVRRVPTPEAKPAFAAHPRLRRASPISQYAVAAALEALGPEAEEVKAGRLRLGIILCVMSGCVNYSRRFYDETLRDPATASPLVFPDYTLVGDPGSYLQSWVIANDWLEQNLVDGCVIIGAEEADWLTADAFRLFTRQMIIAEGAGAVYVRRGATAEGGRAQLAAVSDARLYITRIDRDAAVRAAAHEAQQHVGPADGAGALLCDGQQGVPWLDRSEQDAWKQWPGPRVSPRRILGEGLMAAAAWQCIAALDRIERGLERRAVVQISGLNEHVMWAEFAGPLS